MNEKVAKKLLKKVVEDYSSISDSFDKTRQRNWDEFEQFLKHIKDNDKLADLGCGNGRLYKFLKEKKRIKYIGIDNNEELLKKAKKNILDANFLHGDLLDIPLGDEEIDVVAAIASFHHIPSKELRSKAIKEIGRVIKKNGILIMTNWNLFQKKYKKYIWKARWKHLKSFGKYDWRDTLIPWGKTGIERYYYAFTNNELKKLLQENNFEIIDQSIGRNLVHICRKIV